ncbi:hypothetical protein, partial [Sphingobacterium suaedae]
PIGYSLRYMIIFLKNSYRLRIALRLFFPGFNARRTIVFVSLVSLGTAKVKGFSGSAKFILK